jgi:predicted nucleic acid-binding protein
VILYLDTSSLVKLYIEEDHSSIVHKWVADAEIIATSRVAFPEMMSALARRHYQGDLDGSDMKKVIDAFNKQWDHVVAVDLNEKRAGELAINHRLRGFDAVHLDAALAIRDENNDIEIFFSAFDNRLNEAALNESLKVLTA